MSKSNLKIDPEKVHSAITTWSGFVYQGKVALYHTIKLLGENRSSDLCKLQLDSLEDFAILDAADKCLSLHQIKAVKSTYYSRYSGDFKKLCAKSVEYKCTDINFHLAIKISDKSVADIELAHPTMKIYVYNGTVCHCPMTNIDSLIEGVIKDYYTKQPDQNWKVTPEYLTISRNALENIIQEKVIFIHSQVHQNLGSDNLNAYRQTLLFKDFLDVLNQDINLLTSGPAYFFSLLRRDLNIYYQDFCTECDEPVAELLEQKMDKILYFINGLDQADLVKFMRKIMPHRKFMFNTISDYKHNTANKEEMKDAFFNALYELKEIDALTLDNIGWSNGAGEFLAPTSIDRPQAKADHVCHAIMDNIYETDIELPYETSGLITSNIDVDSVYERTNKVTDVSEESTIVGNKDADKINRWKKITLKSLPNAKISLQ
ncbi:MAG: hypothetical protein EOO20_01830 [Chryseobacterium sp.]|nr:MAG: hypothetical protein EOO20_01830 [Chryseobacterium sp.]